MICGLMTEETLTEENIEKRRYLTHCYSDKGLKSTGVYRNI